MIRDRDRICGTVVTRRLRAMGIRDKPIAPASPWQNSFAERLIGSIRRECVDHFVQCGTVMTDITSGLVGTIRPAKRCQRPKVPGCAIRSISRKTLMDITTLLIIVLLFLLLGGGGWYGRGRWY